VLLVHRRYSDCTSTFIRCKALRYKSSAQARLTVAANSNLQQLSWASEGMSRTGTDLK